MSIFYKAVEKFSKEHRQKLETAAWVEKHGLDLAATHGQDMDIYENYVNIEIAPNDIKSFRAIRFHMGKGWKRFKQFAGNSGSIFFSYRHISNNEKTLNILIAAELAGQNCQIVQTGTIEIPTYKIVLNLAARLSYSTYQINR